MAIENKMIALFHWIDEHLEDSLTTEDIIHKSGYSKRQLHNIFVKYTGCGIAEYVRKKKLHYASTLLKTTKMSVHDIAEKFHFDSAQGFSRAFKKHYKLTPTEYRTGSTWGRKSQNIDNDPLSIALCNMQIKLVSLKAISIKGNLVTCRLDTRKRKTYWNKASIKFRNCIEDALSHSDVKKVLVAIKYSPSDNNAYILECSWIIDISKNHMTNNKVSTISLAGKYIKASKIAPHDDMKDFGITVYRDILCKGNYSRRDGIDLLEVKKIDENAVEYTYFIPITE